MFSEDELAEMPSCNLAESVHNKWLQASGNNGGDLYVATVDDYIRAFLQVVNYYQYLKGDVGGTGPSKQELKLRMAERRAQKTGDPKVLKDPMLDMPGADEFCTRDPHMAGEEVFGSLKRTPDLPLGADDESHRPDKVNFSHPRRYGRKTKERTTHMSVISEEDERPYSLKWDYSGELGPFQPLGVAISSALNCDNLENFPLRCR